MKKFVISKEVSPEILKPLSILNRVSDYIETYLLNEDYGEAVNEVFVIVNCINPKILGNPRDFETGLVVHKKYTKAKKALEFDIKLNYSEIVGACESEVIDIFFKGLLASYSEIEALDIKNFDIGRFYDDLKNLSQDRAWLSEPYQEKVFQYQQPLRERTGFSQSEKMPLDIFWNLVEEARARSQNNLDNQIEIITSELSKGEEKEIVGFECTLRELLIKANHYNVMAVQKIIEGSINDDSFLYFRCKLILYGRITYENAINNPNYLFERIDPFANGELLLSAADRAFSIKFGDNTDKVFPREYASEVIDYDFGNYQVQGKEWEESDIPKRYSKLWKIYH